VSVDEPFTTGHYAFLVDDDTCDAVIERIRTADIDHWADPGRQQAGRINRLDRVETHRDLCHPALHGE